MAPVAPFRYRTKNHKTNEENGDSGTTIPRKKKLTGEQLTGLIVGGLVIAASVIFIIALVASCGHR